MGMAALMDGLDEEEEPKLSVHQRIGKRMRRYTCVDREEVYQEDKAEAEVIEAEAESRMKVDLEAGKLRSLLLVISACAEAFPSGRCWGSTSHKHWYSLRQCHSEEGDDLHVNLSSLKDLAVVIRVVANILEATGGSTGDPELQILSLLMLLLENSGLVVP